MVPDPNQLTDEDREELFLLAEREGKEPGELLRELVHEALATRKARRDLLAPGSGSLPPELSNLPPGDGPSGVLDALLAERAGGR